jgi:putative ABC transport system substrate-binding protein
MKRREFIRLVGGAAAALPLAAHAQQPERMRRIGVLTDRVGDTESLARFAAFKRRLQQLGWTEGRDIRFEVRTTGDDIDKWGAYASELIASAPDAIVVNSNPGVAALKRQTQTIPVVFVLVGDPVGSAFVESLARPGGNITGFMHFEPAMGGKWLDVLKEVTPTMVRAMVLQLPESNGNLGFQRAAEAAGPISKVAVSAAGVRNAGDIERTISAFAREPNGGLIVLPNPVNGGHRELIADLAIRHRLPTVSAWRYMVASGTLISYGIDTVEVYGRAATYVDRILRGEKSGDLPVQGPTKFELVINLKTAKALGLEISATLLARADEVIE